jgi:hypothetical protein
MPVDSAKLNEDEEAYHQSYAASVGACISTIIKYMSIFPVGALIGLLMTISGFTILISGINTTVTLFEDNFGSDFGGTITNYSVTTACFCSAIAFLVCYRGCSERLRDLDLCQCFTCFGLCPTRESDENTLEKMCSCLYGLVMDVLTWFTVALSIVATVITTVLMTLAISTEVLCDKSASTGSISDILDELNKPPVSAGINIDIDKIEEVCEGAEDFRVASVEMVVGTCIVLFAAVIELVYWNKYSVFYQVIKVKQDAQSGRDLV